jgi:outer membrane receptor protein involved in Fe transport
LKINTMRQRLLASSMICGAALLGLSGTQAAAQTASGASEVDEIVVTGSRIARQDYVSVSPIVTVGSEALERTGSVTVETLLNELPQFVPSVTSTTNNPSNNGQANIELRGLGTSRTLVLMDGRRVIPSNSNGTVDVNIIPAPLLENIEVITGGASATYGSDAIAGVVNFRLRNNYQGLEIDTQYGITDRNDGQTDQVALTAGSNFAEDRGNAVVSVSYSHREPILNADRPFSAVSGASATSPYGRYDPTGTNLPTEAAVDAVFARYGLPATAAGVTSALGFNPNGTLFNNGQNYKGSTAIDFSTIPGTGNYNTGPLNLLQTPMTRYGVYNRINYKITDSINFYNIFNFTTYESRTQLAPTPAAAGTGFSVPVSNPFIPSDLRDILGSRANPTAPFLFRIRFTAAGPRIENDDYTVWQDIAGLNGDVGFGDWTWDIYGSYGRSELTVQQSGNISRSAVNTLFNSPTGGTDSCSGGFNPFGLQAVSSDCVNFISRTTKDRFEFTERVVEFNTQGTLLQLPAGAMKAALGADYRRDQVDFVPDSLLSTGDVIGFNASDTLRGSTDVYELYGELLVPIVKDLPFVKNFEVNLGYRFSDYSTVGAVQAYRADGDWTVVEGLRVRGGYQRAVRAPNISELYSPEGQNFPAIGPAAAGKVGTGDPCDIRTGYRTGAGAAGVRALCLAQGVPNQIIDLYTYTNEQVQSTTGGNPDLFEETADTFSVGLVLAPKFEHPLLSRLSASIDYYNIKIKDAVGTLTAANSIQKCFNADGSNPTYSPTNFYCTQFERSAATGEIIDAAEFNANLASYKTSGIDFQVDWAAGLGDMGLNEAWGMLRLNVLVNYLDSFKVQQLPGDAFTDLKGTIGDTTISSVSVSKPKWKGLTSLTYSVGPFDIGGRWRFIDGQEDISGGVGTKDESYFDINTVWRVNDTFQLRAGVNNVSDNQPPFFTSQVQANTDPSTYDVLGRRYYVGLKARF